MSIRSGSLFKWLLPVMCYCLLPGQGAAQHQPGTGLYTGIELLKPCAVGGLVLEPSVRYLSKNGLILSGIYGHVNFKRDSVYQNLSYRNRGHYFKHGIEYLFPGSRFSIGAGFLYSSTRESGFVKFEGPYFGDKRVEVDRRVRSTGLEINGNYYLPISRRVIFNFGSRICLLNSQVSRGNYREMPVYYVPGAGYIFSKDRPGKASTVGLSLGVAYRLTGFKNDPPETDEYLY